MFTKFLSRKFLIVIVTGICDILVASGQMTPELKTLILSLLTAIGSVYIIVEGIKDCISANKNG